MEKLEVEVFSKAINQPVLRIPNRAFPGVLIQGDSLNVLRSTAKALFELVKDIPGQTPDEDGPAELAEELLTLLDGYLEHYKAVLKSNNMPLPFNG